MLTTTCPRHATVTLDHAWRSTAIKQGDDHARPVRCNICEPLEGNCRRVPQAGVDGLRRTRDHGPHAGGVPGKAPMAAQGAFRRRSVVGQHGAWGDGHAAWHLPRVCPWRVVGRGGRRTVFHAARLWHHARTRHHLRVPGSDAAHPWRALWPGTGGPGHFCGGRVSSQQVRGDHGAPDPHCARGGGHRRRHLSGDRAHSGTRGGRGPPAVLFAAGWGVWAPWGFAPPSPPWSGALWGRPPPTPALA